MSKRIHILMISATLIVIFLAFVGFSLFTMNAVIRETKERGMTDIRHIYYEILSTNPPVDFQKLAVVQAEIINAHVIIVDSDFVLLADSHKYSDEIPGKYISANISDAKLKHFAFSSLRSLKTRELILSVARTKEIYMGRIIIQLIYKVDQLNDLFIAVIGFGIILIILITALVFLLVSFSMKRYQKPIHKLIQHTKDAARGGFSKISTNTGSSELIELVENFNLLVDRYNLLVESDNKKYSRINTLLANMHAGILMVDPLNTITMVNPKAERLLNLNKSGIFKDQDETVFENRIIVTILSETRVVNEQIIQRNISVSTPEDLILDISIQAIFNKYYPYEHSGALVIIQDVTEIRRLERLKDEFVSNVSHEFRTPLTVISGFAETLKSWELLSGEDRNTALNIIDVETERLKKMVSELMVLSRIEGDMNSRKWSIIDPSEIAREVVSSLHLQCKKKGHKIQLDIPDNLKPLFGMTTWFRQILFNLYDNAIKYTPDNHVLSFNLKEEDTFLIVDVIDSGPGIPEEEKTRIFERFYRIDKSRNSKISGSGLGLAITRQMVIEFKGTIEVFNNPGGGSVFRVTIPLFFSRDEYAAQYNEMSAKKDGL